MHEFETLSPGTLDAAYGYVYNRSFLYLELSKQVFPFDEYVLVGFELYCVPGGG